MKTYIVTLNEREWDFIQYFLWSASVIELLEKRVEEIKDFGGICLEGIRYNEQRIADVWREFIHNTEVQ